MANGRRDWFNDRGGEKRWYGKQKNVAWCYGRSIVGTTSVA